MSTQTVRSLAADQRVLGALQDGPLTVNELHDRLLHENWEAWAKCHGYEGIEWGDVSREPFGARLMAWSESDELGLPMMQSYQIDNRLRRLEKRGEVERIQIKGRRPMLWQLPAERSEAPNPKASP